MGGRAAEELVFNDTTTGASSDINHATNIARSMVEDWGMSDLGPINWGTQYDATDMERAWVEPSKISSGMQTKIDEEIKKLVENSMDEARKILRENRKKLDELAEVLVKKESIDMKEFEEVMGRREMKNKKQETRNKKRE